MARAISFLCASLLVAAWACADESKHFAIEVVDDATGRGVPLVELRTVDNVLYVTDSAGLVAIREPALLGQKVYFHIRSHGYEYPADGFGYRGRALDVAPGQQATLRLKRVNVAQRLYRVTGADIYRDSVLLGRALPIARPLVNAQVVGSDSVNSVVYRGRLYWFWGDTNRLGYPLGCFHVPGATSRLPGDGGLPPERGVDLEYFTRDDGFVSDTCKMPGDGPTWIDGVCVIRDTQGRERMFAKYVKVRKFLEVYERGLVEFDADARRFDKVVTFDFHAPLYPHGHALAQTVQGQAYVYFGNPYPLVRVPADPEALGDPGRYEAFTCLASGATLEEPKFDRDENGAVRWRWRHNAPPPSGRKQAEWLAQRKIASQQAILALRDVDSGQPVVAHAGSVAWNDFRRRYVMIAEQAEGTSALGEVWYAEADTPTGPWVYARKVVTHDKYSFYNPRHHPMLDQDGGRRIFFEGTYSTFFSGNPTPTPRYDYNQVMYSLDLDDPQVVLPVAVYEDADDQRQDFATARPVGAGQIAFMALDRPVEGAVAIGLRNNRAGEAELAAATAGELESVAFYALPADASSPPKTAVGLYAWTDPTNGRHYYAVAGKQGPDGFKRAERPLCLVWRYPLSPSIRFDAP